MNQPQTPTHQVLTTMGDFVASEPQLLPGVFHFKGSVPPDEAERLLDLAETAFVPLEAPGCEACPPNDYSSWWSCVRCRTRGLKFASKAQKRALECFGGDSEEPKEQKVEPKQEKADGAGPESLLSQECDDED